MGVDPPDIVALFKQIDADHSGDLNRAELQVGGLCCACGSMPPSSQRAGSALTRSWQKLTASQPACVLLLLARRPPARCLHSQLLHGDGQWRSTELAADLANIVPHCFGLASGRSLTLRESSLTFTLHGMQAALRALGLPHNDAYVGEIMRQYDANGDGTVDFGEFRRYVAAKEAAVRRAFAALDTDHDGEVSEAEITAAMRCAVAGLVLGLARPLQASTGPPPWMPGLPCVGTMMKLAIPERHMVLQEAGVRDAAERRPADGGAPGHRPRPAGATPPQ